MLTDGAEPKDGVRVTTRDDVLVYIAAVRSKPGLAPAAARVLDQAAALIAVRGPRQIQHS
jgi:hypothetical protein